MSKEPAEIIARTLTTFNCYACHERDKVGGPEEALNKLFQTTQPEMGDEGRVPPPLDGVGAKLNPDYLKQILDKGAHDRPYMHTRMPGFGAANVGQLAEAFAALDKVAAGSAGELHRHPRQGQGRPAGTWSAARRWAASSATPSPAARPRASRAST